MTTLDLKNLVQETLPILVVDDDKEILKSLVRDLKSVAQVESTANVEEAVVLVSQNKYSNFSQNTKWRCQPEIQS